MGKRKDGITSITKLRARCSIADRTDPQCCWIWKGAAVKDEAKAAVWLVVNGKGQCTTGPRSAAILSGKTIPPGGRAWATCEDPMCCNPLHAATGTCAEWGAWVRDNKLWVGNEKNIAAAKARGRKASKITLEIAREIRLSPLSSTLEAKRISEKLGAPVSRTLVWDVRIGRRWAEPNPFSGLGAR